MGIRKDARAAVERIAARIDGWANAFSGLGTVNDRQNYTQFYADMVLDPEYCAQLYMGDPLAAIIADAYPEEALRLPVAIEGPDGPAIQEMLERVRFVDRLQQGLAFGRAMGGAIAVLGIGDGQSLDQPFRGASKGARLEYVDVYDRRELTIDRYLTGDTDPDAHCPEVYRVMPHDTGRDMFHVHRSRCLVFGGVQTPNRERQDNSGWDYSIYDRINKTLSATNDGYLSIGHMLSDASQAVFKLKGLNQQILAKGGVQRLQQRGAMLDLFKGVAHAILLNDDEEYTRHSANFSGIPDTIDRLVNLLSAVTRIPVTVLMGQAPAGLSATGEGDIRSWYNRVKTYQTREVRPAYCKALHMLGSSSLPAFASLWEPTEKERAEIEKLEADTDTLYLTQQVVSPEDVGKARFTGQRKAIRLDPKRFEPRLGAPPALEAAEVEATPTESAPAPEAQKVALTATTLETILTVNQGLEAYGQPADPVNGDLKIAELKAKQATLIATVAAAESGTDPNAPPPAPAAPPSAPAGSAEPQAPPDKPAPPEGV